MLQDIAHYRLSFLKMTELRKLAYEYRIPKQQWNRTILIAELSKVIDWTTLPKPKTTVLGTLLQKKQHWVRVKGSQLEKQQ